MKHKLIVFLLLIPVVLKAQSNDSTKVFQKVTCGVVFGSIASTSFKNEQKPFSLGYNLSPLVTVVTPRTYHNILYGFGNNSLRSLNGYFLKNNWDTYVIYSKILHNDRSYLGWGIEKMVKIENKGEGLKCFLLTEIGTDFEGGNSLSFGLLIVVPSRIWKR